MHTFHKFEKVDIKDSVSRCMEIKSYTYLDYRFLDLCKVYYIFIKSWKDTERICKYRLSFAELIEIYFYVIKRFANLPQIYLSL